ncbi:hypothetical protein BCR32DRAFT_273464 [Anaeromyces robustus]|uniref:Sugar phosphate transporter domain-containing protein n=1 Tax=Anaeromyces robustus TaxID=1754192 RepID=A0A1Y1VQL4_9FUNG|nr:hypothetical protein BCR32DRAFT_273464 [Anaeromyces robustus]|eukprot:ORX63335.1 hypothetical protein BCR32DRAFT_273464 [Anaeromyces robustus]
MAYTLQTFAFQAIFLLSGIFSTLITQNLFNIGAADKSTILTIFAQYLGMALCRFFPAPAKVNVPRNGAVLLQPPKSFFTAPSEIKKGIIIITTFEVLGNVLSTVGLSIIGSGIYQVIHAGVIVFNAVFSKYFLNKTLNIKQWLSVIGIALGLSLSAIGKDGKLTSPIILIGIIINLIGTICYSVVYVLNEKNLKLPGGPTTVQQSSWIGTSASSICLVYIILYTIPNYQTLIVDKVKENYGGQPYGWIYISYILLLLLHFLHAYTYFWILESSGAVTTGVLQALRAVTVFFFSSYFFCEIDNAQCLTIYKIESCLAVVTGVICYSLASRVKKNNEELDPDQIPLTTIEKIDID